MVYDTSADDAAPNIPYRGIKIMLSAMFKAEAIAVKIGTKTVFPET